MTAKTKEVTMAFFLMFLLLLIAPPVNAGEHSWNVDSGPGTPHQWLDLTQEIYVVADKITFDIHVPEPLNFEITGWRVKIDEFFYVTCGYATGSKLLLEAEGWGDDIYYGNTIRIESWLWVNPYSNRMEYWNVLWHDGLDFRKAVPNNGWAVYPGSQRVYVYNRDSSDDFTVYDFKWHVSLTQYSDLSLVPFNHFEPGSFLIGTGLQKFFTTPFGGLLDNAYLYFHYKMRNATLDDVAEIWGSHNIEQQEYVGGFQISVDKFLLLTPYFGPVLTILVALAGTVIYIKHTKRRKEKQ